MSEGQGSEHKDPVAAEGLQGDAASSNPECPSDPPPVSESSASDNKSQPEDETAVEGAENGDEAEAARIAAEEAEAARKAEEEAEAARKAEEEAEAARIAEEEAEAAKAEEEAEAARVAAEEAEAARKAEEEAEAARKAEAEAEAARKQAEEEAEAARVAEEEAEAARKAEEEAEAARKAEAAAEAARKQAEEEAEAARVAEEEAEAARKAEEEAEAARKQAEEEAEAARVAEEEAEVARKAEEEAEAARVAEEAEAARKAEEEAEAARKAEEEAEAARKAEEEAEAARKAEEEAEAARKQAEEEAEAARKAEEEAEAARKAEEEAEAARKAEEEAEAARKAEEEAEAARKAEEEAEGARKAEEEAEAARVAAEEAEAARKAEEEAEAARVAEEVEAARKAEEEAEAARKAEEEAEAACKAEEEAEAARVAEEEAEAARKAEEEAEAARKAGEEAEAARKAEEEAEAARKAEAEAEAARKQAEEEAEAARVAEEAEATRKAEEEAEAARVAAEEAEAARKAEEEAEAARKAEEEAEAARVAEEAEAARKAEEEAEAARKAGEAEAARKQAEEAASAAEPVIAAATASTGEAAKEAAESEQVPSDPNTPYLRRLHKDGTETKDFLSKQTTYLGKARGGVVDSGLVLLSGEGIQNVHGRVEVREVGVDAVELMLTLEDSGAEMYVNGTLMNSSINMNGVLLGDRDRLMFGTGDDNVFTVVNPCDSDDDDDEMMAGFSPKHATASYAEVLEEKARNHVPAASPPRSVTQSPQRSFPTASHDAAREAPEGLRPVESSGAVGGGGGNTSPAQVGKAMLSSFLGKAKSQFEDPAVAASKVDVGLFQATRKQVARVPPQLLRKFKIILLGHEEVGKTSLKKCWQSGDPRFFKKLPDVMCTTGIESQDHKVRYEGHGAGAKTDDDLTLSVLDFAGQEVYHSHSLFLTQRTVFCFVWKMTNSDEGEMSEIEESRMMGWLDEVYSKAPGSSAVIIGTHKDELPNQNLTYVNNVLLKVKKRFQEYAQSIQMNDDPLMGIAVAGCYAVSCKTRQVWGGPFQSDKGAKLSELLRSIGQVAFRNCLADRKFPSGAIPGRHIQFLRELERIKAERKKLLLPIQEYTQLASDFGIDAAQELSDCTMLFHCWNVIYVFTQSKRLLDNQYIFLHPLWLSHMVSAMFSYAHLFYTPPSMRKYIGGLDYQPLHALSADRGMLRSGLVSRELLSVVFTKSIKTIRNERPEQPVNPADLEMCVQLLKSMDTVFQCTPTTYCVPSLFPDRCPPSLLQTVPYLFQKGVSRMYLFNIFPKEFYYRLICRIHHLLVPISIPVDGSLAPDLGEDAQFLPPDYSYEVRNYWKDGAWIGAEGVRAFIYQEDTRIHVHFLPVAGGREPLCDAQYDETLQEFVKYVDDTLRTLSQEYDGLAVSFCHPCLEVCVPTHLHPLCCVCPPSKMLLHTAWLRELV